MAHETFSESLYQGEPISERGIRKLVVKYRKEAGIAKKASCHTLRHTFATYKLKIDTL
jgi:site-specific recombinase XerD